MKILKSVMFILALMFSTTLSAQNITSVHGTVSDDMGPLMGAAVREIVFQHMLVTVHVNSLALRLAVHHIIVALVGIG